VLTCKGGLDIGVAAVSSVDVFTEPGTELVTNWPVVVAGATSARGEAIGGWTVGFFDLFELLGLETMALSFSTNGISWPGCS